MRRALWTAAVTMLSAAGSAGCGAGGGGGGGGADVGGDVCQKADACGVLSGISAAQCKQVIDTSLGSMSGAARSGAENAYRACLGMTDCAPFKACIDGVMGGTSTGSGGSATGGTGG